MRFFTWDIRQEKYMIGKTKQYKSHKSAIEHTDMKPCSTDSCWLHCSLGWTIWHYLELIGYKLGVAWVQRCRSFKFDKLMTFGVNHVRRPVRVAHPDQGLLYVQKLEHVEKAVKSCVETAPQESIKGWVTFGPGGLVTRKRPNIGRTCWEAMSAFWGDRCNHVKREAWVRSSPYHWDTSKGCKG